MDHSHKMQGREAAVGGRFAVTAHRKGRVGLPTTASLPSATATLTARHGTENCHMRINVHVAPDVNFANMSAKQQCAAGSRLI